MKPGKLAEVRSVLTNRAFAIYTTCNSISMVGVWMQRLAVGWLTWQLTESELWIGAIAFADLLPVFLVGPLAGVWVDRPMRQILMKWCQSIMLIQSLVLFALAALDLIGIWSLFSLVLINGVVAAIYHPIRLSVVPSLVQSEDLMAAVSMTAVTFHMARFVGPALAGLVIAMYGIPASFLIVALSYTVMLVAVFYIKVPRRPWLADREPRSVMAELHEGTRYVLDHKALASILILQVIIALFARPVGELLPAFVGAVFSQGAEVLAILTASMGAGAVIAGLRLLLWDTNRGLVSMVLTSTILSAVGVIAFSLTMNIWLASVFIFLVAYWVNISGIAAQTLIQTCVEQSMRGRVLSLWAAIYRGAPGVGALFVGWLSVIYGVSLASIFAALVCIVATIWMYRSRAAMTAYFDQCSDGR